MQVASPKKDSEGGAEGSPHPTPTTGGGTGGSSSTTSSPKLYSATSSMQGGDEGNDPVPRNEFGHHQEGYTDNEEEGEGEGESGEGGSPSGGGRAGSSSGGGGGQGAPREGSSFPAGFEPEHHDDHDSLGMLSSAVRASASRFHKDPNTSPPEQPKAQQEAPPIVTTPSKNQATNSSNSSPSAQPLFTSPPTPFSRTPPALQNRTQEEVEVGAPQHQPSGTEKANSSNQQQHGTSSINSNDDVLEDSSHNKNTTSTTTHSSVTTTKITSIVNGGEPVVDKKNDSRSSTSSTTNTASNKDTTIIGSVKNDTTTTTPVSSPPTPTPTTPSSPGGGGLGGVGTGHMYQRQLESKTQELQSLRLKYHEKVEENSKLKVDLESLHDEVNRSMEQHQLDLSSQAHQFISQIQDQTLDLLELHKETSIAQLVLTEANTRAAMQQASLVELCQFGNEEGERIRAMLLTEQVSVPFKKKITVLNFQLRVTKVIEMKAQQKRYAASQNRLSDIEKELEDAKKRERDLLEQLSRLSKQVQSAKEAQNLVVAKTDEVKVLEERLIKLQKENEGLVQQKSEMISLYEANVDQLHQQLEKETKAKNDAQQDLLVATGRQSELASELAQVQDSHDELEQTLTRELPSITDEVQNLKRKLSAEREAHQATTKTLAEQDAANKKQATRIKEQDAALAMFEEAKAMLQERLNTVTQDKESIQKQLSKDLSDVQSEKQTASKELTKSQAEVARLKELNEKKDAALMVLHQTEQLLNTTAQRLSQEEASKQQVLAAFSEMETEHKELQEKSGNIQTELRHQQSTLQKLESDLASKKREVETLTRDLKDEKQKAAMEVDNLQRQNKQDQESHMTVSLQELENQERWTRKMLQSLWSNQLSWQQSSLFSQLQQFGRQWNSKLNEERKTKDELQRTNAALDESRASGLDALHQTKRKDIVDLAENQARMSIQLEYYQLLASRALTLISTAKERESILYPKLLHESEEHKLFEKQSHGQALDIQSLTHEKKQLQKELDASHGLVDKYQNEIVKELDGKVEVLTTERNDLTQQLRSIKAAAKEMESSHISNGFRTLTMEEGMYRSSIQSLWSEVTVTSAVSLQRVLAQQEQYRASMERAVASLEKFAHEQEEVAKREIATCEMQFTQRLAQIEFDRLEEHEDIFRGDEEVERRYIHCIEREKWLMILHSHVVKVHATDKLKYIKEIGLLQNALKIAQKENQLTRTKVMAMAELENQNNLSTTVRKQKEKELTHELNSVLLRQQQLSLMSSNTANSGGGIETPNRRLMMSSSPPPPSSGSGTYGSSFSTSTTTTLLPSYHNQPQYFSSAGSASTTVGAATTTPRDARLNLLNAAPFLANTNTHGGTLSSSTFNHHHHHHVSAPSHPADVFFIKLNLLRLESTEETSRNILQTLMFDYVHSFHLVAYEQLTRMLHKEKERLFFDKEKAKFGDTSAAGVGVASPGGSPQFGPFTQGYSSPWRKRLFPSFA